MSNEKNIKARAVETLDIEGKAVLALKDRIGDEFVKVVNCILACPARVVVKRPRPIWP